MGIGQSKKGSDKTQKLIDEETNISNSRSSSCSSLGLSEGGGVVPADCGGRILKKGTDDYDYYNTRRQNIIKRVGYEEKEMMCIRIDENCDVSLEKIFVRAGCDYVYPHAENFRCNECNGSCKFITRFGYDLYDKKNNRPRGFAVFWGCVDHDPWCTKMVNKYIADFNTNKDADPLIFRTVVYLMALKENVSLLGNVGKERDCVRRDAMDIVECKNQFRTRGFNLNYSGWYR